MKIDAKTAMRKNPNAETIVTATRIRRGDEVAKETDRGNARGKGELVNKLLERIEQKLQGSELKANIGDFIRLLQLQKEFEEEQPREITVTWIEPSEKEDVPVA